MGDGLKEDIVRTGCGGAGPKIGDDLGTLENVGVVDSSNDIGIAIDAGLGAASGTVELGFCIRAMRLAAAAAAMSGWSFLRKRTA